MNSREVQLKAFNRLLDVMDKLRLECPWDKKQTFESLRPNTIEETYELCEALIANDKKNICKELGDVLLHIIFYAKIGSETNDFDIADVCNQLCDKLIYRHPHVYPPQQTDFQSTVHTEEEVTQQWEILKTKEKDGNSSILSGVPSSLPSIIKSYRIQQKVQGVGFDWEQKEEVWNKVKEEIEEFEKEITNLEQEKASQEFGDLLFSLINVARKYHINPDNALELTNQKFTKRFNYIEKKAKSKGTELNKMNLYEMESLWNEAKRLENNNEK